MIMELEKITFACSECGICFSSDIQLVEHECTHQEQHQLCEHSTSRRFNLIKQYMHRKCESQLQGATKSDKNCSKTGGCSVDRVSRSGKEVSEKQLLIKKETKLKGQSQKTNSETLIMKQESKKDKINRKNQPGNSQRLERNENSKLLRAGVDNPSKESKDKQKLCLLVGSKQSKYRMNENFGEKVFNPTESACQSCLDLPTYETNKESEIRYLCYKCGLGFITNNEIVLHELNHDENEGSEESNSRSENPQGNLTGQSGNRPFFCCCGERFRCKIAMLAHKTTNHKSLPSGQTPSDVNSKNVNDPDSDDSDTDSFDNYMNYSKSLTDLFCLLCDFKTITELDLKYHVMNEHPDLKKYVNVRTTFDAQDAIAFSYTYNL